MDSSSTTMLSLTAVIEAKVPVMLVGESGAEKTEVVQELAEKMNYELVAIVTSELESVDITAELELKLLENKKIILFFDDFSNASKAVQEPLFTVLLNRNFPTGEKMPDEVIVIGGMTPTDSANEELNRSIADRMFLLKL